MKKPWKDVTLGELEAYMKQDRSLTIQLFYSTADGLAANVETKVGNGGYCSGPMNFVMDCLLSGKMESRKAHGAKA
jgi:hypothetical protein